jgi:hypothetical protein
MGPGRFTKAGSRAMIGVDEETAMVGGLRDWTVQGRQSVWRLTRDGREELPGGTAVTTST